MYFLTTINQVLLKITYIFLIVLMFSANLFFINITSK